MSILEQIHALQSALSKGIIDQEEIVDRLVCWLTAICSSKSCRVRPKPGAFKSLTKNLDADLSRIQITPDLLAADINIVFNSQVIEKLKFPKDQSGIIGPEFKEFHVVNRC